MNQTFKDFEAKRLGRIPNLIKRKSSNFLIDQHLPDKIQLAALELTAQRGKVVSMSDVVNDAISYYLELKGIKS